MAAMSRLLAGLLLAALPSLGEAAGKNPFSPDMAPEGLTTTGPPAKYASYAIVHSTNKKVFGDMWEKRAMQTVDLANRSDVAYYAKRECRLYLLAFPGRTLFFVPVPCIEGACAALHMG